MSASRKARSRNLVEGVIDHLKKTLDDALKSICLTDVRVGLIYTGVALSTGHGGVAYNFGEEASGCRCLEEAGEISGKTARAILPMAKDWDMVKASIGIATANALSHLIFQRRSQRFESADAVDLIRRDDKVVMVGYLAPLVPKIEARVSELRVLERPPLPSRSVS